MIVTGACDGWAVGARGAAAGPSAQGGTRCSGARSRPTDVRAAPRRRLVDGVDLLNVALGALINLGEHAPALRAPLAAAPLPSGGRLLPLLCRMLQARARAPRPPARLGRRRAGVAPRAAPRAGQRRCMQRRERGAADSARA